MVQFTRLRLSGFKSFVEPTEFEIGKGLTGIVGPNGCGKSNLVEALRWAMGENSPKRMRSSGMDDVIFNGTERRPARNTAEVILSLDNSDRTAPAELNDADELEVSRKIEREVGSTYKVNGKGVRMRDVQILFADSSIGAHSPAMVSQGRVADMINAKPAQRRMVLEEAAGISGLHARRHEAELKLRAAEQNLTRVEDVVGAMNVQLDALKKQARQASRYRNLSGHISTAEGSVLFLRWTQSTAAVEAALAAFNTAEDSVRAHTLIVTELTTRQTETAVDLPELRQKEAAEAAALQRLKLAYGGLESEERQVRDEQARAENLLARFTADVAHENEQKEEATASMGSLRLELSGIATATENHTAREAEALAQKDALAAEVSALETDLSAKTEQIASREAERNATARAIEDLGRKIQTLDARKQTLETQHADVVARTPARAELDAIAAEIGTAETAQAATALALQESEETRAQAETAATAATEAQQESRRTFNQISAEAEGLRRILRARQEGFAPVIDQLSVESGLEKALAVALGDDLQAAIDDTAPIRWRALDATDLPALPAGASALSGFVRGPAALSRALSQVGVVESAEAAESLLASLLPGQSLVTRDGGAWRWDGLTVSSEAENAAAVRLQQMNRLAELEAELEKAQERLAETSNAATEAAAAKTRAVETVSANRQAAREAEETLQRLRKRHAVLSDQLSEVTAHLSALSASIQHAGEEAEQTRAELATRQSHFETLPDTARDREAISDLRRDLSLRRETLASAQAAHAGLRREGEARTARAAQIDVDLQAWAARADRVDLRLIELGDRIAQANADLARLVSRPGEIEAEKQNLLSHIAEAEQSRQTAADALATAENAANECQRELRAAENALSEAREARAMAQAGVSTTQHTQAGFEAQIAEKFQSTPEELPPKLEFKPEELPSVEDLQSKLDRLLRERDNMGPVNLRAEVESQEIETKMASMTAERDDLMQAIGKLREGIGRLNKEARERLLAAFDVVNGHFQKLFTRLFNGGQAYLKLIEAEDPLEAGLEIYAQPPGKKLQVLSLLSGGEQTLTSIALIFAMFLTNPAPICVLDEVDAPLDESNVDRYCTLLEDLSRECKTRFIVVTHHRMTMARMDRLYGVTMSERGVSQLVSVDLAQHELNLEQAA